MEKKALTKDEWKTHYSIKEKFHVITQWCLICGEEITDEQILQYEGWICDECYEEEYGIYVVSPTLSAVRVR